jgi:YbbR domain-containing protein
MTSRKIYLILTALLAAAMLLAACGPTATEAPTAAPEQPTEVVEEPTEAVAEQPTEEVVAAIEGSITMTLPVTVIGLLPTYSAEVSPDSVDAILSGPIPDLDAITPTDIRAVADVSGLGLGTHQVEVVVDLVLEGVRAETVLPAVVEVNVRLTMTPTATMIISPTLTVTPEGTPQP